ncbi:hypothetical protein [Capnocytophaga sp. oral taxon 336]|nr:hypothetical protein [Capnocytophaga sp. oral taxon 336]EPE00506.1 hypothetical protein HMPREF1528_00948 [Capnocytophaga sp. oral taxon 336 str. F0502]
MTLQQHFAKYIFGETEQIEALCALFSERTLKKKECYGTLYHPNYQSF